VGVLCTRWLQLLQVEEKFCASFPFYLLFLSVEFFRVKKVCFVVVVHFVWFFEMGSHQVAQFGFKLGPPASSPVVLELQGCAIMLSLEIVLILTLCHQFALALPTFSSSIENLSNAVASKKVKSYLA
jgi:hypothetical protein